MNARRLAQLAPLYVAWNSANKRARATYLTEQTRATEAPKQRRWRTECGAGHEYTPENTRIVATTGDRRCRACARIASAAHYAKVRAA